MAGLLGTIGISMVPSTIAQMEPSYGDGRTLTTSRGPNYGGGTNYEDAVDPSEATYVVESVTELENALEESEYGDIVFVPRDVEINTGARTVTARDPPGIHIPEGVTLAGDRGVDGSPGGLIYTETVGDGWPEDNWPLAVHSNARVTGLRIRGRYWDWGQVPRNGDNAPHDGYLGGTGLILGNADFNAEPGTTQNVEVDNCEFYGWGYAGVMQHNGATDCRVHHCDFHDTLIQGTGYGVSVSAGHCEIDHCTFNRNRHAIASGGSRGVSYEAHHNVVGPYSMSHVFDVHRPGGDRFDIHHNTVMAVEQTNQWRSADMIPAVAIRGVPTDEAWIHHNWFYNPQEPRDRPRQEPSGWSEEAIIQVFTDDWDSVDWNQNHYGFDTNPDPGIGAPWSDKVSF